MCYRVYPSLTQIEMTMRAPFLVKQFTHLVCIQPLPSLSENYLRLLYLLWKITDKADKYKRSIRAKKAQRKKPPVSTEINGFLSPSGVKLLALLGQSPLLLLPANPQSRKLLASGGLFGSTCFFFVVYPDV